jgi:hypothetical protein
MLAVPLGAAIAWLEPTGARVVAGAGEAASTAPCFRKPASATRMEAGASLPVRSPWGPC